jgi:hypothetical protein
MTAEKLLSRQTAAGPAGGRSALDLALVAVGEPEWARAGRWWVVCARDALEVRAALGGRLPAGAQRLTRLAAGPALLAVRLAVAVSGHRPFTTLFPDPRHPAVLAVVRSGTPAPPTQTERALFAALVAPGQVRSVPTFRAALPLLRRAADVEGAWMRSVVEEGDRERLLTLLPGADRAAAAPDARLLVLGSHHLRPTGDVEVGQAMQRVRLTARALGLTAAVIAGPAELAPLRAADVPGAGPGLLPQLVLQLRRTGQEPAEDVADRPA